MVKPQKQKIGGFVHAPTTTTDREAAVGAGVVRGLREAIFARAAGVEDLVRGEAGDLV